MYTYTYTLMNLIDCVLYKFCALQNGVPEIERYSIADRVYCSKRIYFLSTQIRTACEKLKLILQLRNPRHLVLAYKLAASLPSRKKKKKKKNATTNICVKLFDS